MLYDFLVNDPFPVPAILDRKMLSRNLKESIKVSQEIYPSKLKEGSHTETWIELVHQIQVISYFDGEDDEKD